MNISSELFSKKNRFIFFEYSVLFFLSCQFYGNWLCSLSYIILLGATMLNLNKRHIANISNNKIGLSFILFFFLNGFSSLLNAYNFTEFAKIEKLLPFLLFPLVFEVGKISFSTEQFQLKCRKVFFFSSIISLLVLIVIGLFNFADTSNLIYLSYNHLAEPLGIQPIYLGAFYTLSIIFGIDILGIQKTYKLFSVLGVIWLIGGVLLLGSRTNWIIMIVVLFVKAYGLFKNRWKLSLILSLLLTFGAVVTLSNSTLKQRLLKSNTNISSYSGSDFRVKIWKNVVELIQEKPIIGYGIYNSEIELQEKYVKSNFRRAYLIKANAHNQYLQTLLDSGLLTLMALILIFLFLLKKSREDKNTLLFTLIVLISFLTESYFRRMNGVLFFCFFALYFTTPKKLK